MSQLSPEGQRMVEALREERLSDAERARVRARLLAATLAGSATVATTSVASAQTASGMSGAAAKTGAALAAKSAAVTAPGSFAAKVAGASLIWKLGVTSSLVIAAVPVVHSVVAPATEARAPASVEVAAPAGRERAREFVQPATLPTPRLPAATLPSGAEVEPADTTVQSQAEARRIEPPGRATRPLARTVAASTPPASTLAEESALIERALRALGGGDLEGARSALADHRAKYPDGVLRPERELTRARLEHAASGSPSAERTDK